MTGSNGLKMPEQPQETNREPAPQKPRPNTARHHRTYCDSLLATAVAFTAKAGTSPAKHGEPWPGTNSPILNRRLKNAYRNR